MAITLGSVTVAADGNVSKSGECGTLYDLLLADVQTATTEAGATMPTGAASVGIKKNVARMATTIATYCHGLLTARASAKIAAGTAGLQRMSNPVAVDVDAQGPTADKFLPIV